MNLTIEELKTWLDTRDYDQVIQFLEWAPRFYTKSLHWYSKDAVLSYVTGTNYVNILSGVYTAWYKTTQYQGVVTTPSLPLRFC